MFLYNLQPISSPVKNYACSNELYPNNKRHVKCVMLVEAICQKLWAKTPWLQGTYFWCQTGFYFTKDDSKHSSNL